MLPPELLRLIVYHIYAAKDRGSLYALSLTSKLLCLEGERFLYRNITLPGEGLHSKFLTTISSSHQKALLVHSYSQDGTDYAGKQRLWNLLAQSIKIMHNLTHLSFRPSFLVAPEQIGQWDFQLHSLDCRGGHDVGQALSDFLQSQPRLRRLGVDWAYPDPAPITSSICPALELLRGNRGAIEAFLPGRHIIALAWTPHPADSSSPIDHLAPSLNNLRALSLGGSISRPSLNLFVCHLQSLEVIKLIDASPEELTDLQNIPNLRVIILLSEFNRRDYSRVPPINWGPVVQTMFLTCKTLACMEISTHRKNYERWIQGVDGAEVTLRSFQEVHDWWQVQRADTSP